MTNLFRTTAIAALLSLTAAGAARADVIMTYTGVMNGSAHLIGPTLAAGGFVTSATGTVNGVAITGLNSSYANPDNKILAGGDLDFAGISFDLADGDAVNLFRSGPAYLGGDRFLHFFGQPSVSFTDAAAPAPEPGAMALFPIALAGLAAARRRLGA